MDRKEAVMPKSKRVSRGRSTGGSGLDEDFASAFGAISQLLRTPDAVMGLIEILLQAESGGQIAGGRRKGAGKKAKRAQTGDEEMFVYGGLLTHGLEELRYGVESGRKGAADEVERLRQYLVEAGRRPGLDPHMFLFVLQQFAVAKVDIGEELRSLAEQAVADAAGNNPVDPATAVAEVAEQLRELAEALDGDPFAIHAQMSEFTQTLPVDVRAMIAAAVVAQDDSPGLRDAALGWLLDDAAEVRRAVAQMLEQNAGSNVGSTLRRMIALRNWVPEADRPALDRAIKASQKKVVCASWAPAKVLSVHASGYDGSGAQSMFIIAGQGRKRALGGLLFKQDFGVRDAWAGRDCTPAEVKVQLDPVATQMSLKPVPLEYAGMAIRHFLGINAQSGVLPPFGLLDVAELAGLPNLNPEFQTVDGLVSSLCADMAPELTGPKAVARALKTSASWSEDQPLVQGWFEESEEASAILARRRLSKAKRKAALLAMPLRKRRGWWAGVIARTGLTLKQAGESGWEDYILVARELLGNRPLDEFGIMNEIAEATLDNY
jgi:hypothetical protein